MTCIMTGDDSSGARSVRFLTTFGCKNRNVVSSKVQLEIFLRVLTFTCCGRGIPWKRSWSGHWRAGPKFMNSAWNLEYARASLSCQHHRVSMKCQESMYMYTFTCTSVLRAVLPFSLFRFFLIFQIFSDFFLVEILTFVSDSRWFSLFNSSIVHYCLHHNACTCTYTCT